MKHLNKNFYISTSILYASGIPHIGNIYEIILADAIARFKRLEGYDVFFQTGMDEHGQKIEQKAIEQNKEPKKYVDDIFIQTKKIFEKINIKYDYFIRTTDIYHKRNVQMIIKKLLDKGDIYLGTYEGWYLLSEENYVLKKDLINDKMPNGEIPIWVKEEVYFFKLAKYQDRLLQYLKKNFNLILPKQKRKEILNLLQKPLPNLSISRTSFKWGIPLNFNSKHIVYVWIDALTNYISGLGYNALKNFLNQNENFLKYWPCNLHVIGKDIIRFHLIYWPILLMALDLPLPKQFLVHPWILFNGKKMSKSTNNVIYLDDLLQNFSSDAVRYFVLHKTPYLDDGVLTYDLLFKTYNSDLVNTLGNLLSRTLGMIVKYRNNQLTKILINKTPHLDFDLSQKACETVFLVFKNMKIFKVSESLENIINLARLCNKYIDMIQPWNLIKDQNNLPQLDFHLYRLVETIRFIGVLLKPFLPETSKNILKQIQAEKDTFESIKIFGVTESKKLTLMSKIFVRLEKF